MRGCCVSACPAPLSPNRRVPDGQLGELLHTMCLAGAQPFVTVAVAAPLATPSPSLPPPRVNCGDLSNGKKCKKIKIKKCNKNPKSLKKCKRMCNQDAGKTRPLCQKPCCTLGFTV